MHLKKSIITNYQSHKKSVFHWHPGVNVIVGLSCHGKSAAFRAHNWVIKNRSEDKSFRSNWGGKTDVELIFQDGPEVSRVQRDSSPQNSYYLLDSINGIDEEWDALKSLKTPNNIPEKVIDALNLDSINIQGQFDPPFLLGETPAEVAKQLNKIANLSDIDNAISNIRKKVLANSRDISTTEQQITDLEEQAKSFQYLEQMEKDVVVFENLETQWNNTEQELDELSRLLVLIFKAQVDIEDTDLFLKAEKDLETALSLAEEERQLTDQIKCIETLISKIKEDKENEKEINTFLKAEEEMKEGLLLVDELKKLDAEIKPLQELITIIQEQKTNHAYLCNTIVSKNNIYEKLMPSICPLCEQEIK